MGELDDSWQNVAGEFRTLGYAFRDHYRATKGETDTTPSEEEVRNALHTVTDAVDTALTSVGKAIRDPDVQKNAKDAASSLVEALGTSFTQLGEAIDRAFRKSRSAQAGDREPPVDEEADAGQGAATEPSSGEEPSDAEPAPMEAPPPPEEERHEDEPPTG
jgi:hypothetical protein